MRGGEGVNHRLCPHSFDFQRLWSSKEDFSNKVSVVKFIRNFLHIKSLVYLDNERVRFTTSKSRSINFVKRNIPSALIKN